MERSEIRDWNHHLPISPRLTRVPPRLSVRPRECVRTHLIGCAAERVPVLPTAPDAFARGLRLGPQRGEIDAGNAGVLHPHHAVDDDGVNVVANAAIDEALDRIAHRPEPQRVTAG